MRAAVLLIVMSVLVGNSAVAATFVYVSNAEDGDIGLYKMGPDGALTPGQRFKAERLVMPMAVSPDKRFLIAAVRSDFFSAEALLALACEKECADGIEGARPSELVAEADASGGSDEVVAEPGFRPDEGGEAGREDGR